jgi:hypothetical protein
MVALCIFIFHRTFCFFGSIVKLLFCDCLVVGLLLSSVIMVVEPGVSMMRFFQDPRSMQNFGDGKRFCRWLLGRASNSIG